MGTKTHGQVLATGKEIFSEARNKQITFLAASLSYYAVVSLIPILLIALAIISTIGGGEFATEVVVRAREILTPTAGASIQHALTTASGRSGATIVGILTLSWSTIRIFRGINLAFAYIYETETSSIVKQIRDSMLVLVAIGIGFLATTIVGTVLALVPALFVDVLSSIFLIVSLVLLFLPVYYFLPNPSMSLQKALPGTIFAAVSWTSLQALFGIYAANADQYAAYGVLGGLLLLITWFYFAGIVLLMGAVINAVIAKPDTQAESQAQLPDSQPLKRL